jgi:hypothetical protein
MSSSGVQAGAARSNALLAYTRNELGEKGSRSHCRHHRAQLFSINTLPASKKLFRASFHTFFGFHGYFARIHAALHFAGDLNVPRYWLVRNKCA